MTQVTWTNVFLPPKRSSICEGCLSQFERITPTCPKCGRGDSTGLCFDCERWGMDKEDPLEKNTALFAYNDFAKDWVAKWKYRGDYELLYSLREQVASLEGPLVPIPLSDERLAERGFNQSEAVIRLLGGESVSLLERSGTSKQSKKQRAERVTSENPFRLVEPIRAPVTIVDDIYTTGTTLRHAASLLKEAGCPSVSSFTIFR
ncbi:ComF family protein [Halobacillus litoralis]|uniref:ComF family protein n=1 Tax=Halobacillus litoralis TaxID=45668 RepID=UPI001CD595F1|nr:ComF family protein [Halobacillus litoralis]MCA0971563.1 ComF family protein [Halobacillus litoralis]